ncbi:thiamine-phosphate kinase [Actinocorallia sp. A-T 12471]|uniref:thiamine-phosphate kinase n=1 Tax=Actinocorallia sp. A-T 12471 TaxID=3089813 RepID=UPI0029D21523|nr:thiamine-phosphate kinase [Actinocorallia sp. A-T 12471]MDX6739088.1 thiamine-phosphate kinase [Actinocorallia sp. A-T 12471]
MGEFGLIRRVTGRYPQGPLVELGPGDDAAVLRAPDGRVVATADMLVEGRHFRTDWSSAYDVGRKAAAQNLADVVAMGARPTALLIGFGAPADLDVAWADGLSDGLRDECALLGVSIVGGDTVRTPAITVAVTALGDLGGAAPLTRSGARPGEIVAVRGRLGWAAMGLAALEVSSAASGPFVDAHRRPLPPYSAGGEARALGATSLVDVSDGLVQDLGHVARASAVRIELAAARVPRDPGVGLAEALTGGDDHAFAATFPADAGLPPEWRVVGEVREGEPGAVTVDGRAFAGGGWDHFGA